MTTAALHTGLRSRLEALRDGALVPVLDAWAGAGAWPRVYGRVSTAPDPWAVLAFASPDRTRVVRVDLYGGSDDFPADAVPAGPLGRARPAWATDDPALPGLAAVLAELTDPVVERYRPGRRCTVSGGTPDGKRFVKIAADAEGLHRAAVALWAVGEAGELGFAVARPHGWDPATGALWQGTVPGVSAYPWLLTTEARGLARRMGSALGRLAVSSLAPTARTPVEAQAERSRRTAVGVVDRVPALASRLGDVLARLDRWQARLRPRDLVPVHGAPHGHQWLLTRDGGLGLIDFDRCAWGDPELDAATLLAELDSDRGRGVPLDALAVALVAGYRETGVRIDADRLGLYLAHKRLARVRRLCWSTKPDGDRRAAHHLDRVEHDLRAAGF